MDLTELKQIRQYLHKHPELSHKEKKTSEYLRNKISDIEPDFVVKQKSGEGFWARFGKNEKGSIAFRTDIDALPIQEINEFEYKSVNEGVAHKCGHDGHATSMLGFAYNVKKHLQNPVDLIFQAAEETGEGAESWLKDVMMRYFSPEKVFAYHNLPGFPLHSIIVRNDVFTAASVGITIKLFGKTSHAGHPERGVSPALAVADLVTHIEGLPQNERFNEFTLTTVVHALLGEIAFGTAPGYAEVRATLRSYSNDDLKKLQKLCEDFTEEIEKKYGLKTEVSYSEYFPATENNNQCVNIVRKAAQNLNLQIVEREEPFRWSEDFAHFTLKFNGALFGIGSGEKHPQLHNPDYDFPDEILSTAINMFTEIYKLSDTKTC
ncbi:MAG: amidohydrolase [Salinivirgaceae bacterium]|nr:MAG: amidohydrolase [Salinivirgaceae bacterium]